MSDSFSLSEEFKPQIHANKRGSEKDTEKVAFSVRFSFVFICGNLRLNFVTAGRSERKARCVGQRNRHAGE